MSSRLMVNKKWFDTMSTKNMSFDDIVNFVQTNEQVKQGGRFHKPILHSDLLMDFKNKAEKNNVGIDELKVALSRDGMKIMCLADTNVGKKDDYSLSCGFRNSTNSTWSYAGNYGSSVFICCNNCISGLIAPSKQRNTVGNYDRFGDKIDIIFDRFASNIENIHNQIDTFKGTKLSDEIVGKLVKGLISDGEMGNKHICDIVRGILDDVETPALNRKDDDSCFRLFNACTKVCTHDVPNPMMGAMLSRKCNNILMGIIKDGFVPLGDDVVEAEVEVLD